MLKTYLAIGLGGFAGTVLRLGLASFLTARFGEDFPVGTLTVNVSGSFAIGFIASLAGPDGVFLIPPLMRQVLMIGVLGGYTTFSSFSLQTVNLLGSGDWPRAGLYIVLSVVLCLVAVWLGQEAATALQPR